jgi:tricorn protease
MTRLYALVLKKDGKHPFPPESDEVKVESEKQKNEAEAGGEKEADKQGEKGKAKPEKKLPTVVVDFEGLGQRVVPVPLEGENYGGLAAVKGYLLYIKRGAPFYGRDSYAKPGLYIYDLKKREESLLVGEVGSYAVSADGKKVLVQQGKAYKVYESNRRPRTPRTCPRRISRCTGFPRRSGRRFSARCGVATATSFTCATCTATTGKPLASNTRSSCLTSSTAAI